MRWLLLLLLLLATVTADNYDPELIRTVRLIHAKSRSQLLLLICMSSCYEQRVNVAQWLRTYSNQSTADPIHFHYHFARHNFPYFGLTNASHIAASPIVLYITAGREFRFQGALTESGKTQFINWLESIASRSAIQISGCNQLNDLMNEAMQCESTNKSLLLINNDDKCGLWFWNNIAKSLSDKPISVLHAQLDQLEISAKILIEHRLASIADDGRCAHVLIVHRGAYLIYRGRLGDTQKIRSFAAIDNHQQCNQTINLPDNWQPIGAPLTDIELEYFGEELKIARSLADQHLTFIVIGTTGGIAVIVLAISIFWGLNGSSFT